MDDSEASDTLQAARPPLFQGVIEHREQVAGSSFNQSLELMIPYSGKFSL